MQHSAHQSNYLWSSANWMADRGYDEIDVPPNLSTCAFLLTSLSPASMSCRLFSPFVDGAVSAPVKFVEGKN